MMGAYPRQELLRRFLKIINFRNIEHVAVIPNNLKSVQAYAAVGIDSQNYTIN